MAKWTHNMNANKGEFTPLTLAKGKSVTFPGISGGNIFRESLNNNESVRRIMERKTSLREMHMK